MSFRIGRGGEDRPCSAVPRTCLLLGLYLCSAAQASWHVRQVAFIARGITWTEGYVVPYVPFVDSQPLLLFSGGIPGTDAYGVHFYRYGPMNRYALAKLDTGHWDTTGIYSPGVMIPWTSADLDGDSVSELVAWNGEGYPDRSYNLAALYVPSSGSPCPDSLVCSIRYDSNQAYGCEPFYITDLDQDDRKEVFLADCGGLWLHIYECDGHHSLRPVATLTNFPGVGFAFGDFDQDGQMEFASAGQSWRGIVSIGKCLGDDQYVIWETLLVNKPNGSDAFGGRNIDGTGRNTFFVSFWSAGGWIWLYQFEPTQGTHGYEKFLVDSTRFLTGDVNARSICGDIDGDGIDEILWSTGGQIRVYKCTGPHQYERVWTWYQTGNNSCNLNLHDMNGNGYNEILESGSGMTHIFEIEAIKVLFPNGGETFRAGDTCLIRWETYSPPRCDSISLFLRTDTGWTLDTIVTGLAPTETSYQWVVPDVPRRGWQRRSTAGQDGGSGAKDRTAVSPSPHPSPVQGRGGFASGGFLQGDTLPRTAGSLPSLDSCRIVAIAYGPGWQYDESDNPFRILPLGVAESPQPLIRETRLLGAFPNPCNGQTTIRFQLREEGNVDLRLCDATGRTVAILAHGVMKSGYHSVPLSFLSGTRNQRLPPGIYFLNFTAGAHHEIRKLVVTK